jgi:hypothetical protein
MTTRRLRNDFINFIMEADRRPNLMHEFMTKKSAKALYLFFQAKGFKDIPYNDCQDILMARKSIVSPSRRKGNRSGTPECPEGQLGY